MSPGELFDKYGWMGITITKENFGDWYKERYRPWIRVRLSVFEDALMIKVFVVEMDKLTDPEKIEQIKIRESKDGFWWLNFQAGRAMRIIEAIHPQMEEQKKVADLVLGMKGRKTFYETGKKLPVEEAVARKAIIEEIKRLNGERFKVDN